MFVRTMPQRYLRSATELKKLPTSPSTDAHSRLAGIGFCCRAAQLAGYLAIAIVVVLLLDRAYLYCAYALTAIRYPFGLNYGEGIVWQQALLIPSSAMYGDINKYPYIVFHYPPLYHLVIRLVTGLGADWLSAGRAVSVVSTLTAVLLCGVLIYNVGRQAFGRVPSFLGGVVGGLAILTQHSVIEWSILMRVDMLALAVGLAGLLFCERSFDQPRYLYIAVIAFIAAIYTKQTAVAAAIAGVGPFLVLQPRRALPPVVLGLVLAAAILAWLSWYTNQRFLQHIVEYNISRFDWRIAYWWTLSLIRRNAWFILVGAAGMTAAILFALAELRIRQPLSVVSRLRHSRFAWVTLTLLMYLAASSATLITQGKSGADVNYTIEWLCVLSLFVGLAVTFAMHCALQSQQSALGLLRSIALIVIASAIGLQVWNAPLPDGSKFSNMQERRQLMQLARWVREARRPVLSDDMVLLLEAGKQVPLEPSTFAELAATGRWDERRSVDLVKSGFYQFIVTVGDRGDPLFNSRYNPAVIGAIEAFYPRKVDYAGYKIHLSDHSGCDVGPPLRCTSDGLEH